MKKTIILLALALSVSAFAQENTGHIPKNSINIGLGGTVSAFDISEFHGKKAFAAGMTFHLDYTRFITRHWGVFIEGDLSGSAASQKHFYKKVATLDKGDFTYSRFKTGARSPKTSYASAFIGAAYRYDIGKWSIRPRLGAGIADYGHTQYRYYRTVTTSGSGYPQAVFVMPTTEKGTLGISETVPAIKAGIQFQYYLTGHFHIGADLGLTGFISKQERYVSIYNTKRPEYDIGDAVLDTLLLGVLWREYFITTDKIYDQKVTSVIPPIGSLSFSIGWDF